MKSPQRNSVDVQLSASKFYLLSDEVEEGEISGEEQLKNEMEVVEVREREEESEGEDDLLEDSILAQQSKEKDKAVQQKGMNRGRKAKARDANPVKSIRSSRRNH